LKSRKVLLDHGRIQTVSDNFSSDVFSSQLKISPDKGGKIFIGVTGEDGPLLQFPGEPPVLGRVTTVDPVVAVNDCVACDESEPNRTSKWNQ
jgi:hypothetical protein